MSEHTIPKETNVLVLESEEAFLRLTDKEKNYAHFLTQAANEASPIVLFQTSPESPLLFALFLRFFDSLDLSSLSSFPKELLVFASHLFTNMGNYKSFGDSKFIPEIPADELEAILRSSPAWVSISPLWEKVKGPLYSLTPREKQLGFGPTNGISTYYTLDVTKEEAELVQGFMDALGLSPYNTRLFKLKNSSGQPHYELRLASARDGPGEDPISPLLRTHEYQGSLITIKRGDYSPFMKKAIENLKKAQDYAANENESEMIGHYIKSFEIGSIDAHKEGSRFWIKDKGPVVETYIGFIESYRDPLGVRGEWEGFVAFVNKEASLKYATLVENAPKFLPLLPWPKEFEKDTFLRPDFTSLEVLSFAGSGIPAGINIPNYDDIRQTEGFKNVSLGNVLSARSGKEPVSFLTKEDQTLFQDLQAKSFEVQVALHELLGHGSGKLFSVDAEGAKNFPPDLVDPLTGKHIATTYAPGKTYDSVFAELGSTLEECRAECVGIYLCTNEEVLNIFGYKDDKSMEEIVFVNWLIMVRAGLLALEYYTPQTKTWRQAHVHARHAILRVLLEAGEGLVSIERITGEDGNPDLQIRLDRTKIKTVGRSAIGAFLQKIQVFKSTANYSEARKLYDHYTSVDENFLSLREIVLSKKKPRPIYCQPLTQRSSEGLVSYKRFGPQHEEVIRSNIERFRGIDREIESYFKEIEGYFL